jgi:hypothetical protein
MDRILQNHIRETATMVWEEDSGKDSLMEGHKTGIQMIKLGQ